MTTTNPSTDWEKEFDRKFLSWGKGPALRKGQYVSTVDELKTFIQSLLSRKEEEVRKEDREEVVAFIREICSTYQSPIGTVYRVAESTLDAALMEFDEDPIEPKQ